MYRAEDYVLKTLEVVGGPLDGRSVEMLAPGSIVNYGPNRGAYEERGGKWYFIDMRLHRLAHRD